MTDICLLFETSSKNLPGELRISEDNLELVVEKPGFGEMYFSIQALPNIPMRGDKMT